MQYIHSARMFFFLILFGGILSGARAQGDTHPARGFMPNMDQLSSPVDNIAVNDGKLHLQIPLASLPRGKGGTGYDLNLEYDSHLYDVEPHMQYIYYNYQWQPFYYKFLNSATQSGGWTYNAKNYSIEQENKIDAIVDDQCFQNPRFDAAGVRNVRYRLVLPDGSMHILQLREYEDLGTMSTGDGYNAMAMSGRSNACAVRNYGYPAQYTGWLTYYTSDGSYLKLEVYADGTELCLRNWKLYYPDGRRVISEAGLIKQYDANGNYISIANAYDENGKLYTSIFYDTDDNPNREIRINYNTDYSTDTLKRDEVIAPGPNGLVTYTIDWQALLIGGALEDGGDGRQYFEGQYVDGSLRYQPLSARFWTVKHIQLPSPQYRPNYPVPLGDEPPAELSYDFGYWDNYDTVPGYGQLDHMRMPSGALYDYQYLANIAAGFGADIIASGISVSNKQITHDSVSDMQWAYSYNGAWTRITNPDGGQTTYNFENLWGENLVKSIEEPSGSIRARQWARNVTYGLRNLSYTPNNPYIAKEILTVGNSSGNPEKSAITNLSYDKNGNLLSKTEYDWVNYPNSTGVTVKRKTEFNYFVTVPDASAYPVTNDINAYWKPHNTAYWPTGAARRLNAVQRKTISSDSTPSAATEYSYDNAYTKGNVLYEYRWDSLTAGTLPRLGGLSTSNPQVLRRTYDAYGNLTDIYEPEVRTHTTYNPFGNVIRVDKGYGTGAQRSMQYSWNSSGTALMSTTDLDNNFSTSYAYDNIGRRTSVTEGSLRRTITSYDDINRKVIVTNDLRSYADGKLQTITSYDQLGRVILTQQSDGTPLSGNNGIKVQTSYQYPLGGRRVVTSTPYRSTSDATLEWTCTQHDTLGRVTTVAMFKGSSVPTDCAGTTNRTGITQTVYDADWTIVTDPAGKARKQRSDGLDRLVEVVEDPSGQNYSTTYTYNPLDKLLTVTQGTQTPRSFAYSSLGRLTSAYNPESGTVSYSYYDSGDLKRRTDARGVWSESTYDSLHRMLTKTYSDSTPTVNYAYHLAGTSSTPNIGQLKSVSSTVASKTYSYNALGKVTGSTQAITGYSGNLIFSYNWYLSGGLKSIQYPSGRMATYDVDDAGRTSKVYASSKTYADLTTAAGITYPFTADGRIAQMKLGNGLYETRDFNFPGTPTRYKLGNSLGSGNLAQLEYNFSGTQNNGNLMSQAILRPGNSWTQNFAYDGLNRLSAASEVGGYNRTYGYDRWGNRYVTSSSGLAHTDPREPTASGNFNAKNQLTISGSQYDAAGNQTTYSPFTLGYDAESRNTSETSSGSGNGSYSYDGDGRRVKKVWTSAGGTVTTYFVYDAVGQLAAEYSTQPPTSTGTSWMFADMLGSVRAVTSESGSVTECYDYLPFGRMLSASDNGRNIGCYPANPNNQINSRTPQKFTGKERDAETGLDYFGARYHSPAQGRFLIPDPSSGGATPLDPQSWNKYSYVRNRPMRFVDINGNWATEIHVQLTTYALRDYVSAAELKILVGQQSIMDNAHNQGWDQYMHAMSNGRSNPPQTAADAKQKMNTFISWNLEDSEAKLNKDGSFSNNSLVHLGNAVHTLQDTTSPVHMQNGEPLPWMGKMNGGYSHWTGENEPGDGWSGIGRAIRRSMGALMAVNPKKAAEKGLTDETFEREAAKNIGSFFDSYYSGSEKDRGAARLCALGNSAACFK